MVNNLYRKRLILPVALAGGLMLAACVNNDYNFDDVDSTVGIGSDGLELPGSSTDTIKLLDVLELEGDECVKVAANGDYVFVQEGGAVDPSHPMIDRIRVARQKSVSSDITIGVAELSDARSARAVRVELSAEGDMQSFEYEGDKPDEVVAIDKAAVDARISLRLHFPAGLSSIVGSIDELTIEVPSYMTLEDISSNGTYSQNGSKLTFSNIPTARDLTLDAGIAELDFGVAGGLGSLTVAGGKILLDGRVHVKLRTVAEISGGGSVEDMKVTSTFSISDFDIESATGRFNPIIDLSNLGDVDITGVPDFLTDGNVVVDLYNPQILLTLTSDMEMEGLVSGDLTAIKNGAVTAMVHVPEMRVKAGGSTSICICRRADAVTGSYDVVRQVDNLSELIRTIPDRIEFAASARADDSKTCTFELGRRYTLQPGYSVEAPITFDKDASIVYKDTLDGWNDDIKDFELAENSYISVTANIENRVPAYLKLSAQAIDMDGNVMDADEISVEVENTVLASADGENSAVTPLAIRLRQAKAGAMKRLDGLVLTVGAGASDGAGSVVGKTLNSEKHFLIARDIRIKLVGKLTADFN